MKIWVNGRPVTTEIDATLLDLMATLGLQERRVAIERNDEVVPRSLHGETRLREGDRIEIVHAIGGG